VEQRLSDLVPAKFLRPAFFMENLAPQLGADPSGHVVIRLPMGSTVPLQMVAVCDVGVAATRLLLDPQAVDGDALEVAGDELTLEQVAAQVGEVFGRPARFEEVPLDALGDDADLKAMFRWFATLPAYQADFAATRRLVPEASDLRAWLSTQQDSEAAAGAPN
jgi:uncharacterized protein YbjT (DUF2867 family)